MPSSEQTPLIQRVPVNEIRQRYSHSTIRRFCTVALSSTLIVCIITALALYAVGSSLVIGDDPPKKEYIPHKSWPESEGISYNKLKNILLDTPDAKQVREWSKYYTAGPHLAGKNLSQAEWTRDRWQEFGIKQSEVVSYDVFINYPIDHRLALLKDGKVKFEATLEEDVLEDDPTTGMEERVPVFHGYSANGNVTAQYVYCNYGTYEDFEDLKKAKVELKDKIAVVKYGRIFRGLKIKRAEDFGMVGVVIYTDPYDDGPMTEENGYEPYPAGPARQPSSVQRGSVSYLSIAPGDPTTIGYPSKPGVPRQSTDGKIPRIPSLPLSYAEAIPILKALNGHGPKASSFSSSWQTGGLGYKGVKYNIGPSPPSLTLNLVNEQEYVTTPIWNTIGIINGSISDEVIVIGNHRDAWIAGGAGDPNSGSAALNEVIRSFGVALEKGWKPLRTIVFASWDGEEYGLIGSTEWVEEFLPWLSHATVAYINMDVGAKGKVFRTSAAPLLNKAIYEATSAVPSPNQTIKGQTVRDTWNGHISTMGSGSDFTAFQDFAGIASIDIGFDSAENDPVYHYHSNYDSFYWMDNYGDPGFEYHLAVAKIIALLTAQLCETPIVNFNATDYAIGLANYLDSVKTLASKSSLDADSQTSIFASLETSIASFKETSSAFDAKAQTLASSLASLHGKHDRRAAAELYPQARSINTAYKLLERQFLYDEGLDSRSWFKHVVFAPGLWTGYAGATFPGLVEAFEAGDKEMVMKWLDIIEMRVDGAISLLEG
ncbi:Hypothetical protein R9X50_00370700 [Acrodontium crateriforme]|uniref:Glutamate carboxypeptidase n=1 Tax=Acrodontium crateriforme TaxID=150365 RepID=A0AAQ3R4F6_9PEZI|nr:Hypothetical protein R9X50_00370700 [Acrodontium crateriforme]